MKRFVLLFFVLVIFVSPVLAEEAKVLPSAESITVDLDNYYGQKIEGYYNFDCVVSEGLIRTAKFYVPAESVFNQPTVFIGVPNGTDTWEFLVSSGWKDLADELKLYIVAMEPVNQKWGDIASESDYINALNEDVSFRPFFCTFSSNFYGVGYGEFADILLSQAINKPKSWAGIAVIGTNGLTPEEAEKLRATPSRVPGISLAEIQTPIWIVSEAKNDVLIDFFKNANHSVKDPVKTEYAPEVYKPMEGGTVDDNWCADVVVDPGKWQACVNLEYSRKVYKDFLEGLYRYPGNANGALRKPGEIFARGFKKFAEKVPGGYTPDGSDLYNREWYVYYPESAKAKADKGEKVPAVFVFHGAGGSGNEIGDRSGWAAVAKERGLIMIAPTGSIMPSIRHVSNITTNEYFRAMWYPGQATEKRPNDLLFVKYLYDWALKNYPVDASRMYVSGQSSGGFMSWAIAAEYPDLFAGAAPISANTSTVGAGGPGVDKALPIKEGYYMPVICFMGEEDTTVKNGFAGDDARENVNAWVKHDKLVENYETYTYMKDDSKAPEPDGFFTRYAFRNAEGVTLLLLNEVATKAHAIWPSECFYAWDEFLINFTRDPETHKLYYKGEEVK